MDGDTQVDSNQDKATLLSNYFSSSPVSIASVLLLATSNTSDAELYPLDFPHEFLCWEDSIADLLTTLDTSSSKYSGADGISARMFQSTAYSIASSLFNQSLAN